MRTHPRVIISSSFHCFLSSIASLPKQSLKTGNALKHTFRGISCVKNKIVITFVWAGNQAWLVWSSESVNLRTGRQRNKNKNRINDENVFSDKNNVWKHNQAQNKLGLNLVWIPTYHMKAWCRKFYKVLQRMKLILHNTCMDYGSSLSFNNNKHKKEIHDYFLFRANGRGLYNIHAHHRVNNLSMTD